ncbi:MBL fold metallo-hydrolase [Oceanobacillus oncorhynchi subsp. oncorhynchi]|uniref:MBL fold metallo-hydrolase n=1 Tax=Oceanobacillus TaxID=182709 RepID=UPI0030DAF74D
MEIIAMPVGLVQANCYIVYKKEEKDALVIDPGGEPEKIIAAIEKHQLNVRAILLTHAHFDHIGGLERVREFTNAPVYLHKAEWDWLGEPKLNGSAKLMGQPVTAQAADKELEEGPLEAGGFFMEALHTPGHSPGSISFVFPEDNFAVCGDVLFQQGIGRTDLVDGDIDILEHTVREKLYRLPEDLTVLPGHGPATTIGYEKKNNPFFPA